MYFRIIASVAPVFRLAVHLPDTSLDEDAGDLLIADLDTVFLCSGDAEFRVPSAPGLIPTILRNGEFSLRSRRDWFGETDVVVQAAWEDSTLADTFHVTVNGTSDPPRPFDLWAPPDGDTLRWDGEDTLFVWQAASDPDGDAVTYRLNIWREEIEDGRKWSGLEDTTISMSILSEVLDVVEGGSFHWTVTATDGELERPAWSTFTNYVVSTTVPPAGGAPPADRRLAEVFPNPFNNSARIGVHLRAAGVLRVDIFDTQGRSVENLVDRFLPAGDYIFDWRSPTVGSGVYLVRVRGGDRSVVRSVVFIR